MQEVTRFESVAFRVIRITLGWAILGPVLGACILPLVLR